MYNSYFLQLAKFDIILFLELSVSWKY